MSSPSLSIEREREKKRERCGDGGGVLASGTESAAARGEERIFAAAKAGSATSPPLLPIDAAPPHLCVLGSAACCSCVCARGVTTRLNGEPVGPLPRSLDVLSLLRYACTPPPCKGRFLVLGSALRSVVPVRGGPHQHTFFFPFLFFLSFFLFIFTKILNYRERTPPPLIDSFAFFGLLLPPPPPPGPSS